MAARAKVDKSETTEGWFVVASLVEVSLKSGGVRQLGYGSVLGDDVSDKCLEHLKGLGFIAESNPATEAPAED